MQSSDRRAVGNQTDRGSSRISKRKAIDTLDEEGRENKMGDVLEEKKRMQTSEAVAGK